jgi:hypothetical protein
MMSIFLTELLVRLSVWLPGGTSVQDWFYFIACVVSAAGIVAVMAVAA